MADLVDRFPLAAEFPESVLARLKADMNAGIDPADPLYADLQPGSVWDDMTRAFALEIDRVYDRMFNEVPAACLPATATGQWLDAWADTVGLQRKAAVKATGIVRFEGTAGTDVGEGVQVSTEAPTSGADAITFQTTESGTIEIELDGTYVDLHVEAVTAGSAGNVAANSVTILDSVIGTDDDPVTVTNPAPITSGDDDETDERLQARVLRKLRGSNGGGNVDYYENIALNYPGVGFVTVQPNTPAVGDVRIIVTDINNDPVSDVVIDGLQVIVDPAAAPTQGAGQATIGAEVTVATPGIANVSIDATLVLEIGYSIDGTDGTRALSGDLSASVHAYIDSLTPGADVVRNKVIAALVDVEGVVDVSSLTINGSSSGDVAVAATDVAVLTDFDAA